MSGLRLSSLACFCAVIIIVSTNAEQVKLSSGYNMPIFGLGTWEILNDTDTAISAALENGYRHIDTAYIYENEQAIGKSLKKWFDKANKRQDVFITSKLPTRGARAEDVEKYLKLSLDKLRLDYVDMYLIHMPTGTFLRDNAQEEMDYSTDHLAIWKAMETQVKAGRAKSIGLSNFNETQVLKVYNNAEIKPSNLQIELQVYNQQKPLQEFCRKHNISITAWGTLGSGNLGQYSADKPLPKLMENPTILKIAAAHNKTSAQILLRHAVQNGIIVIPKSGKPERIKSNHEIFDFELTDNELKQIEDLDKGEDGRMIDFLVFKGIEKHREYPWPSHLKKTA